VWLLLLWWLAQSALPATQATSPSSTAIPVGQRVARVTCIADETQSYALYLPSNYTGDKAWPVIFAFDPGARGSVPVERYEKAAETYGYIIIGSNNSRNGSTETVRIISTMMADAGSRFHMDPKRIYVAGMSGGARVALAVALNSPAVAGVIASSAGYPDSTPRKTVPFPIFATAGTEDFNHLELRELDRALTSPHRLAIFEGGHVWLSSALATEAVEWMEVQAMKTGLAPRNDARLEAILTSRLTAADRRANRKDTFEDLQSIVADFEGLKDMSSVTARATELGRDAKVRDAIRRGRDEDATERRTLTDIYLLEQQLATEDRQSVLIDLRSRWRDLATQARKSEDSSNRRLARRVLGALSASVSTTDPAYQKIISEYRQVQRGRQQVQQGQ
jgi:predicted esterase